MLNGVEAFMCSEVLQVVGEGKGPLGEASQAGEEAWGKKGKYGSWRVNQSRSQTDGSVQVVH